MKNSTWSCLQCYLQAPEMAQCGGSYALLYGLKQAPASGRQKLKADSIETCGRASPAVIPISTLELQQHELGFLVSTLMTSYLHV